MSETPVVKTMQGDLRAFNIFDVTQSLMVGRKTALVSIVSGNKSGFIHFREGQIVAALDDAMVSGEKAAMKIFAWTQGTFTIEFGREPQEININLPTDHLLLEVARNLDEIRRELGIVEAEETPKEEEEVAGTMQEKIGAKLRREINSIFKRVANTAEPTRARYTKSAFDGLLQALVDMGGNVLILRPGQRPRIRTPTGFAEVKEEAISGSELEGPVRHALPTTELTELHERKETSTFFCSPTAGAFRLSVINEHGPLLLAFSTANRTLPELAEVSGGEEKAERLRALTNGLVVVAGPLALDRTIFVGTLVQEQLNRRGAFAVHLTSGAPYHYSQTKGSCIKKEVPSTPELLQTSFRLSLEQEPDIIALDDVGHREAFAHALAAAAGKRLVIFPNERQTPSATTTRFARFPQSADGDSVLEALSDRLRCIIDLSPGLEAGRPRSAIFSLDREISQQLRLGQIEVVRRLRMTHAPV